MKNILNTNISEFSRTEQYYLNCKNELFIIMLYSQCCIRQMEK